MKRIKTASAAIATLTLLASLSACASGNSASEASGGSGGGDGDAEKSITIGLATGWDEDIAVTYLWKQVLEDNGYNVELKELSDNGPIFLGLARGDLDLYFDGWLPTTHETYWQEYGDDITDVGSWYDETALTLAVPDYVDATTIEDLAPNGEEFDKTIVGIEPGTGLMKTTKAMMPQEGLDDWSLKASSTASMLAALKKAVAAEEPIVVTLWRPHWAYGAFPIRDLEDPNGVMGKPDQIHTLAEKDFEENFPDVHEMVKDFHMTPEELADLENVIVVDGADDKDAAAREWLEDNPEFAESMTS